MKYDLSYIGVTTLHPLAVTLLVLCSLTLLFTERKNATLPILVILLFIASAQRIVVFDLDFSFIRIMIIVGLMRILMRQEFLGLKWHRIDTLIIFFFLAMAFVHIINDGKNAFTYEMGRTLDVIGTYFLFRVLVQSWDDLHRIIWAFTLMLVPVGMLFLIESQSGRNLFSVFGGIPDITLMREGRLRCQGPFSHPILAGVFVSILLPFVLARWWDRGAMKIWVIIGVFFGIIVVVTTASSTPAFTLAASLVGAFMFYFRNSIRVIGWGAFSGLILLHLIMQAPVWHLIARVSAVGGSTSYYRYQLIDFAINRFGEWWMLGTESYVNWFPYSSDLTNEFVRIAVLGGLLSLVLLIAIIYMAFRVVGQVWRRERADPARLAVAWAMGVALFTFCMAFIGVSVWGKLITEWYMLLAIIVSMGVTTDKAAQEIDSS